MLAKILILLLTMIDIFDPPPFPFLFQYTKHILRVCLVCGNRNENNMEMDVNHNTM